MCSLNAFKFRCRRSGNCSIIPSRGPGSASRLGVPRARTSYIRYVCMYIYIYIYMYTYTYIYIYIYFFVSARFRRGIVVSANIRHTCCRTFMLTNVLLRKSPQNFDDKRAENKQRPGSRNSLGYC